MLLLQSILLVGFAEEVKGEREDWSLEVWRGMGRGFHLDKGVQNL